MTDSDPVRLLVPVDDSVTLRNTIAYAVEEASAAAADRPVELHVVVVTRTRSVSPDAPAELRDARDLLERVELWVDEDASETVRPSITVVTDVIGVNRYLFSPGDYADTILEYAADAAVDRIVLDPEYSPGGAAPLLRPLEFELTRGDVAVEEAPVDRPAERTVLARAAPLSKYITIFGAAYLFYMLLSAWKPLDFFTGFVTATVVSVVLAPIVSGEPAAVRRTGGRLLRFVLYAVYLLKEIAVANLQIAYVVLHPDLPIDPKVVRFRAAVWSDSAVTTLANSITLTPGTLTVSVSEDGFHIHSLTGGAREDLFDGGLERAVRFVFYGRAAAAIPSPRDRGDVGEGEDG